MKQPRWVPTWEGKLESWTLSYASLNLWRVHPHHDTEDLIQAGYLIFMVCCKKYGTVETEAHFTALYKRSFMNYVHDRSKTRSGEHEFKKINTEELESKDWVTDPEWYVNGDF